MDLNPANLEQLYDWLYAVIDAILKGLESSASGKHILPRPPVCLRLL